MFDTIAGPPLHPLVVHETEVVVPAAALVVALAALWPRFRRWARFVPLALSLPALVLVPFSTGTVVQSVRIGHGRATAAWSEDMGNPAPASGDSDGD